MKETVNTLRVLELKQERNRLIEWMDANDGHFSPLANEDLRVINEKLTNLIQKT